MATEFFSIDVCYTWFVVIAEMFGMKTLKERDHLKDQDVNWRKLLNYCEVIWRRGVEWNHLAQNCVHKCCLVIRTVKFGMQIYDSLLKIN
jgi:hypothetical protein